MFYRSLSGVYRHENNENPLRRSRREAVDAYFQTLPGHLPRRTEQITKNMSISSLRDEILNWNIQTMTRIIKLISLLYYILVNPSSCLMVIEGPFPMINLAGHKHSLPSSIQLKNIFTPSQHICLWPLCAKSLCLHVCQAWVFSLS
jgi:hypothetical protein